MRTPDLDDVVRELWRVLDDIQEAGFSLDPRDVARDVATLWTLIDRVRRIATRAPEPAPASIERAAAQWQRVADAHDAHSAELRAVRRAVPEVWRGASAEGCRSTLDALADLHDDACAAARAAFRALSEHADAVGRARDRHAQVDDHLRAAAGRIRPVAPWDVPDLVRDVLEHVAEAARSGIDAYGLAAEAARTCARELDRVADRMPFPPADAPGMSALAVVDLHLAGRGGRPLVGDVAERARGRYDALDPAARVVVDGLLTSAPTDRHRAWILAALASGATVATLERFAGRLAGEDAEALSDLLDPTGQQLVQQSTTTCGSASLVVARMLNDPVYALSVLSGYDARTGTSDTTPRADRFADQELAVKGRTNDVVHATDGPFGLPEVGLPWPDAIGTPPWGASEEMNGTAGVPGTGYRVGLIDSDSAADRQQAFDTLARAVDAGRPAPLYVGDELIPRHVVLVVGRDATGLQVYDPGDGTWSTVSERDFLTGDVDLSWDRPWATVAP